MVGIINRAYSIADLKCKQMCSIGILQGHECGTEDEPCAIKLKERYLKEAKKCD